jgi:hypothetical protein
LIFAEDPEIESLDDETLIVFRRFGDEGLNSSLGQISMSRIVAEQPPSPPLYLTDDPEQKWQAVLAINPVTQRGVILQSSLSFSGANTASTGSLDAIASTQAMASTHTVQLNHRALELEALSISAGADPALDPLQPSTQAPIPGSTLMIAATVRNVGRGTASQMTVTLYRGTNANGTPLGTQTVTGTLGFNETRTVVFELSAPAGEFPLFAKLTSGGENIATANDTTSKTVGTLSTPSRAAVSASEEYQGGMQLIWSGNNGEAVSGYRILRSTSPDGPWQLAGESAIATFTDTLVEPGESYCYAVQAYNAALFSAQGPASCADAPPAISGLIFLPSLKRQ